MTIRLNPKGYKPTKKERIEHNIDNFEQKVGKALDYLNAGETTKEQFINEINVAHSNYKRNQKRIYELED
ncbi:hypothetical protein [Jeotgalibaca porci]|uniref:hypothetical protein n=1 Tax=Jeotgalibaca porci TaxID=1868793 RepID=UPI0035A1051F